MKKKYILLNGVIKDENIELFSIKNRAILYGDGFYEKMYAFNNTVPFINLHLVKINNAFEEFDFLSNDLFKNTVKLQDLIVFLARKNKIYKSYVVKIIFFRAYYPDFSANYSNFNYIITVNPLDYIGLNNFKNGISIDVFTKIPKNYSVISQFNTFASSNIRILASKFARENKLDDVILINSEEKVVETIHYNIYSIINKKIFSITAETGCRLNILHNIYKEFFLESGYEVEEGELTIEQLKKSDEIILFDELLTMKYVQIYQNKSFYNLEYDRIQNLLKKKFSSYIVNT